jgi:hypothetical protein
MTTAAELSPFAQAAPDLIGLGYSCLPLVPSSITRFRGRGKMPGAYVGGHWRGFDGWEKCKDSPIQGFSLGLAMKAPGANVGMVLGTVARPGLHAAAIDVDADDPAVVDAIVRCLPASPMQKRGRKGVTLFYAAPKSITSRSFDDHRISREAGVPRRLVDVLTGFQTRQTVCPPSVHPDTMQAYEWLAGPVAASDLPLFDDDAMTVLEETLQQFGYDPAQARGGRGERKPYVPTDAGYTTGDAFDGAKRAALKNVGAWIHDVDNLHGLRPARGGFEAVSLMRDSSSGQPLAKRKRNLSIQANGITDFGTGETFSAIDLVAHHNGLTVSEALTWLEDRLGLGASDGITIDLQPPRGQTASPVPAERTSEAAVVDKSREETAATITNPVLGETHGAAEFPAHLLECPGLVGDLAAWMTRTAQRPLPAANLLTALAIVGTAAGRRFCGPTEAGTAIYGLALAPSGSGKAHPIRAAQHIMRKAGLGNMVAPSSWMSGSALVQHLGRQPVCLTQADEVGEFFAKLNGAKASTHERAISGVIRELFGVNFGSYQTPGWAGSNAAASVPPVIHAPAYSFLGYSVPEAVWEALQGADITNGMLNRFLLVPTLTAGEEQDDPESVFDVPDDLVSSLRAVAEVGGPLASATMHSDMATEPMARVEWEGGKAGDAAALFRELRAYCREHPSGEHLMKRTAEIAIRLATVRAIGRDGAKARVTVQDMDWARNVALFSAERMIHDAAAYMAETEWQQKALGVLRIIREAPGGAITKTGLYRRLNHKYKTAEVKAILEGLVEAGQVVGNSTRTGERGPASITYKAV